MTPLRHALALVVATTFLLAGCGSEDADDGAGDATGDATVSPESDLEGREFVSTGVTVGGAEYPLASGSVVRISFGEGQVGADAGCNQMGGAASYDDGTLELTDGALAMTEMGCEQALMDQDTWLAEILGSSPTLELDGDTLVVTSDDTVIALADRDTVEPDAPLTGTAWTLDGFGTGGDGDGAVSSVPGGVTSTLAITDDGEMTLAPGCNTGGAGVEIADTTLTVGPVRLTKMACEGAAQEVERAVLEVLDGDVDYGIERDTLTLTKDGNLLMYRATPGD